MSILSNGFDPIQYPGKKQTVTTFKLEITVEPGAMIDYTTWVPAKKSLELFDMPYGDLIIEVWYDSIPIIKKQSLTLDPIKLMTELDDDHTNTDHLLRIKLSNKTDKHSVKVNGTNNDAVGMIKVNLNIENLPINFCLDDRILYHTNNVSQQWTEFMGENGEQQIPISTPIYPWLIKHSKLIIQELRQSCQKD